MRQYFPVLPQAVTLYKEYKEHSLRTRRAGGSVVGQCCSKHTVSIQSPYSHHTVAIQSTYSQYAHWGVWGELSVSGVYWSTKWRKETSPGVGKTEKENQTGSGKKSPNQERNRNDPKKLWSHIKTLQCYGPFDETGENQGFEGSTRAEKCH